MRILVLTLSYFLSSLSYGSDSLRIKSLENEVYYLIKKVDQIKTDQLNYQIEKDLIKGTYSNNYDTISLILTGVVGLFGLLTFIGFRDVNSLKKEYKEELEKLMKIQQEIEDKSNQFEVAKEKYDEDIRNILTENDEQNKKIKVLELREKINSLFQDKKYYQALEFCIVALELNPENIDLLKHKARCSTRLKNYEDSMKSYKRMLELDPSNNEAKGDLAELYLFMDNEKASDELVDANKDYFKTKINGELLEFFELIKLFNRNAQVELKSRIDKRIDKQDLESKKRRFEGWDVKDAIIYVHGCEDNESRVLFLNYLWYLDGQLNSNELMSRLGITIPKINKTT